MNIMVLPGTKWQENLIEKIKEKKHKVYCVNPSDASKCFAMSDGHLCSDIFDYEAVLEYARVNNVDVVMSDECDIAMPLVAKLNKAIGASGMTEKTAALFTNKYFMREHCRKNQLISPNYKLCTDVEEACSFFKEVQGPVIIKPIDSNASKGVFKIESEMQLRKLFEEAKAFSRVEKAVLVEEYVDGTEFTIDGIKTPWGHYTLAISEKKHFAHNRNIASELYFTHSNANYDYEKLKRTNDAFVLSSDLEFGLTHAEYKYQDGEFYLIEIAARGGGNMISSVIVQYMSGYDTYDYLVECHTGNIPHKTFSIPNDYMGRAAVLKFFETPKGGGKVKRINGVDYLDKEPDVFEYKFNFNIGDEITDAISDSARIGFYIACSENEKKLKDVMMNIERSFSIELE